MKVTIIGTGYVGLSTGICLAYIGHEVHCVDTDESKITSLNAGRTPIFEPHLEQMLADARDRLTFTTRLEEAAPGSEAVFLAVGTPPLPSGSPDLQFLRAAAVGLGHHLSENFTVIINKSTVPVGSGNWVDAIVREAAPQANFSVASNPEFLREGSAIHDSLYADRIVVGSDNARALEVLRELYLPVTTQSFAPPAYLPRPENFTTVPMVTTDLTTAELIKYAANSFLALKISFINEIGSLASRVGANISGVAQGIGLDGRIGPRFLNAGLGWGGSCFGKDTSAIIASAAEYGLSMPIVQSARDVNYRQRGLVVERLLSELKILKGRTIGLLGIAFKPNTDDLRDAPAIDIARRLIERGARVRAHDPVATPNARAQYSSLEIQWCGDTAELAQGADALVLVTEWSHYQDLEWNRIRSLLRTPVLLDGRLFLDRAAIEAAGIRYIPLY
jgi:UDPglucose 6-dehydrogenase